MQPQAAFPTAKRREPQVARNQASEELLHSNQCVQDILKGGMRYGNYG